MKLTLWAAFAVAMFFGQNMRADLNNGNCSDSQASKVVTNHGRYTTTAGFIEVTANDKKAKACIFYIAYQIQTAPGANRPITFAFNGGPGSSSVWLHLGFLGPKRVDMGENGLNPPSSPALIENESTLLDVSDLVMIDPVATGFSHTEGDASGDKFFGVKNDYTSIASFVQTYLNVNNRWLSPKFIMGESYGGIRGTLLTSYLQSQMDIRVDGLILISPALSDTTFFTVSDNTVPYWTFFPSFAATAWYHHKSSPVLQQLSLPELFAQARNFANTRLKDALDSGADLDSETLGDVAQEMSNYLGITKSELVRRHLRLNDEVFFQRLLAPDGLVAGRYDGRFTAPAIDQSEYVDPSGSLPGFAFTAGINDYLRTELNFPSPSPYMIFGDVAPWSNESPNASWNVMPAMSLALSTNPKLHVLIASGYYDLACPLETVSYEIRQMPQASLFKSRLQHLNYEGGHMMYINPSARKQLRSDVGQFMQSQVAKINLP